MDQAVIFRKEIESLKVSELKIRENRDMKARHFHDSAELYILTEGRRCIFMDRKVHVLEAGQAVLIPPGQIHKTSTFGEDPCHQRFLMQFSRKGSEGILLGLTEMDFEAFCQKYQGTVLFDEKTWQEVVILMDRIKTEFGKEDPELPLVRLLAHELLLLYAGQKQRAAAASSPEETETGSSGVHGTVEEVTQYLHDHLMADISLDDLSRRFFISRAYLTRAFRQVTGVTVIQYLTVIRIRRACSLLQDTDDSVTGIARQCGFSNATYFESVFKRLRGMTPRQYRRQTGKRS